MDRRKSWSRSVWLLTEIRATPLENGEPIGTYTRAKADKIKELLLDRRELAAKKLPYERLDQPTLDILLGVR